MTFYTWDLETFFDIFLFIGKFEGRPVDVFELSTRRNQRTELLAHLNMIAQSGAIMVGFNNLGFDKPIIQDLMLNPYTFDHTRAYQLGQQIIMNQSREHRHSHSISLRERLIPQIDLMRIHHFDNQSRRTSLKALQFNMRSESVEDLPFDPHTPTTNEQKDLLIKYGIHDVTETEKFLGKSKHMIQMRQELLENQVLQGDVLNYSEVKIGSEYLIRRIGRAKCFIKPGEPRTTPRREVAYRDVVLPKIDFRTTAYNNVLDWFKKQTIYIHSEERPRLSASLAGLDFAFGVGGVHASVENRKYVSNETHIIKDIDVSGMYVAVALANGFFPEHLGQDFVTAYRGLKTDRAQYKKGTSMNLTLKLAGNGAFGNSNCPWTCFYDPKYTFTVTLNGQLQLLQLVECLDLIPGVDIIQANTDGVTAYVRREVEPYFNLWCKDWESRTGLQLEYVDYKTMWISDVNNYLAETFDGKVKRKGKYWYPETEKDMDGTGSGSVWNKDLSNLTAQKVIDPVLRYGFKSIDCLKLMTDKFDFMMRYKTTRGAKVFIGDRECSKTVRYYVSTAGAPMRKVAEPKGKIGDWKRKNGLTDKEFNLINSQLQPGTWDARIHTKNKSKYEMSVTSIESGWLVKNCNNANDFDWKDVNYEYYQKEIEKLVIQ